jgi:hypothetical protein
MVECLGNPLSRILGIVVFPHTHDHPPVLHQTRSRLLVTSPIPGDLRRPPPGVRLGRWPVQSATVPEATVYEHGQPPAWEHDVCSSSWTGGNNRIDSKSKTATVQYATESKLGGRVTPAL